MSIMAPPPKPKKPKKIVGPTKGATTNSPVPGQEELPPFTSEHQRDFEKMQERCYRLLHRPRVVKVRGFKEKIYYICGKDLDKYMKKHPELKKLIVSFGR